jgi:hypothetical protein
MLALMQRWFKFRSNVQFIQIHGTTLCNAENFQKTWWVWV